MSKPLAAKTVYNRLSDGWEVIANGAKVETRAACMALAPGTTVTLKRGAESETVMIAGEESTSAAANDIGAILDGLSSLRSEDRKVLEILAKGWERQAARAESLADNACRVAANVTALNDGLTLHVARLYGENNTLRTLLPGGGETQEHWMDRLFRHGPQAVALARMLMTPLPPEEGANPERIGGGDNGTSK